MFKACPVCGASLWHTVTICSCGFDYKPKKGEDTLLCPPFPYFGSKRRVVREVWKRFGKVHSYIEPFFGSGAVFLNCPYPLKNAIVSDNNGFIANFWRGIQQAPEEVAKWADWSINETDLHARHKWLLSQDKAIDIRQELDDNPMWFDARIAGWWAWGQSIWIACGWCDAEPHDKLPHIGRGRGVNRKVPILANGRRGTTNARLSTAMLAWHGNKNLLSVILLAQSENPKLSIQVGLVLYPMGGVVSPNYKG